MQSALQNPYPQDSSSLNCPLDRVLKDESNKVQFAIESWVDSSVDTLTKVSASMFGSHQERQNLMGQTTDFFNLPQSSYCNSEGLMRNQTYLTNLLVWMIWGLYISLHFLQLLLFLRFSLLKHMHFYRIVSFRCEAIVQLCPHNINGKKPDHLSEGRHGVRIIVLKWFSKKKSINDKVTDKLSQNKLYFYVGSALAGMSRTLIGFPIEHPIDSIKTQWQARPYLKNELAVSIQARFQQCQIVRDIYAQKGIKGFYAGALPNLSRCILKNTYRYPLMVGLPKYFSTNLPQNIRDNKQLLRILTGASIALVESTLTCPIERIKVFFMTSNQGQSMSDFIKLASGNLRQELFRGFTPLFMRQAVSWSVFLQTDLFVKESIRKAYKIPQSEGIPTKLLLPASLIVAMVNTAIVMPLDCVKTHMEKVDPTSTYLSTFRTIYQQGGGMSAFFTGYRLRFMLHFTNALFAVNFLEKLETITKSMRQ